jgi:membrane-associated protein
MSDITSFIQSAGYLGYAVLFLIIFFESFPFTFFLPGDSLLFTMGFLASAGILSFPVLVVTLFFAGTLGYICSYFFGKWIKDLIYSEKDTFWFRRKHFLKTREFYDKYGSKTLIIGRFVPVVRSFSSALAGAVEMDFKKFLKYTLIGGVFWTCGMSSVGFYLGRIFPKTELYLTPIILLIIFVSILPGIVEYISEYRKKKRESQI